MSESTTPGPEKTNREAATSTGGSVKGRLATNLVLFTLARLAIVVMITAVIMGAGNLILGTPVPLLVAALFAIILTMPISAIVLRPWSGKINADIATLDANRRDRKEDLRRRMND